MAEFIFFHLPDDSSATGVTFGETVEMTFKMFFDLVFRLGKKSQIPPVPNPPCNRPEGKLSRIPNRGQQAFLPSECLDSVFAPL